ncbi:tRNA (adenosine(37)-N6)-dimethylallyltransferase MiaA [Halorhodospira halophila]|uniref:tRNA dimethylallyltransferase n=1 Tax=Halorhodospira halophila (strain DSM 244 / SL1) TaxID=349124 RepID=MIAA_HALHL|nr:tRNA (adenosine(37)-N6)-dimethylallyltransferase MiaA [Halorhodospira halophila]A1WUT7.1 RecName: Full=tRNA dimethylallyltransferase; AltName: Full=Dimethylallyl diphosphate:tRNA dimethylallyltransferase; Short=DMAPP:tRNA dimethylallyltransferase; Short=DMATase; AltName: Full=Isopentenyl-diphosphate:tRNA isopentenyltransferase; Short=IPP transferase; Short=IPPT; Short=IPTase [Halorhodospira halophila SL1]ABM61449.1 tRNA delta(2)-isopentenylpyrophosphate transferase [Halorhodospira halophila SL
MTAPVLCIMGPTAVGKSELALSLAERLGGEIVSVDSAQIYRGLDIGTAKPSPAVRARCPHHLIDIRDPAERYSAAEFARDAQAAIAAIRSRGRLPVLVGGTGLYFQALQHGLSPMPAADAQVRAELEAEEAAYGVQALHRRLQAVDPESAARLHPNDSQRIQRALEVHRLTGRPLSQVQREPGQPGLTEMPLKIILEPPERAWLHRRIEARFRAMLAAGLVGEVVALHRRGDLSEELPAVRAVGYRQIWHYLEGACDYRTMIRRGLRATRQYAKRQITWLRGQTDGVRFTADDRLEAQVHSYVTGALGGV